MSPENMSNAQFALYCASLVASGSQYAMNNSASVISAADAMLEWLEAARNR